MRVLLVLAHPDPKSYSHAVAARAVAGLESAGHTVRVLDLYAEGFHAAMTAEEREAYHTDRPVIDGQVAEHVQAIRHAEALVFVFPTWWSSLPAILKGWLERTMVPGVAFVFHPRTQKVRPGLTHVRRVVGISTYGSGRLYVKLVNDNGRRTLMRALRLNTGWRTRTTWLPMYRLDSSSDEQRAAFLDKVETTMAGLR